MNIGVYVSLYNDEYTIKPCLIRLKKVFPQVKVFDIGSTDNGPSIVRELEIPITFHLESRAANKYIELKRNLSEKHDWVFWIDGDEVYPEPALNLIKDKILANNRDLIYGWWRNLKVINGKLLYTDPPTHKGPIAYKPKELHLHRDWPREKIDRYDGKPRETDNPEFEGIYCWHSVLLNRSSSPEKKNRMKKRLEREQEFIKKGLKFVLVNNDLDFFWREFRKELLEEPKFVWYK